MSQLELGLDTFGDVTAGPDGKALSHAQVLRNVVDEAVLADSLGVDFIGVGEHHRADFAISAPEVILAAIASRTKRIHLGSAVTVLSSDDPVRVFQRFSTLNAVSNGRAEVILGRGSFTESFPLFGYALDQYEELFSEKLDLFAALIRNRRNPIRSSAGPGSRPPRQAIAQGGVNGGGNPPCSGGATRMGMSRPEWWAVTAERSSFAPTTCSTTPA